MKRYEFRLERLLAIRKFRETEWELKLAGITNECVRLQSEIAQMDEDRRSTLASRYLGRGIDMDYLSAMELYMQRIAAKTQHNLQELETKEQEREEVRAGYLEASRDRKVLDRLKERRSASYRREQLKEETFQIDDMSGSSATWKSHHA